MIREIQNSKSVIYLTFDDGPSPTMTLPVLDLLDQYQAKATFFLVAEKAKLYRTITEEILKRGHSIGNHSLNHEYSVFFKEKDILKNWISQAETEFQSLGVKSLVGFRPPNGICTSKLYKALDELKLPLILWNVRFYDSLWPWSQRRAQKSLKHLQSGSIVLLHDVQRSMNFSRFMKTLKFYIEGSQAKGFQFEKLTRELCTEKF